ncbi:hypothetical protein GOP47_0004138 [Adiantum capillus-veneris]|uniref:tRNA (guanine(26)-N(2))-dimethyltransferase n=1 Tax=Adiantum capillus-veneris TaxID=13818 RepID=A0A9D4V6Z5_ADICA|nr:hypothetical protein GOP47_0004138 [Adiantum capillus-veneris]
MPIMSLILLPFNGGLSNHKPFPKTETQAWNIHVLSFFMWRLTTGACRGPAVRQRRASFLELTSRLLSSCTQLDDDRPTVIKEGQAKILLHGNDVFYNKAQVVNRDLSIAVLRSFIAKRQEELLHKQETKRSNIENFGPISPKTSVSEVTEKSGESCVSDIPKIAVKPFRVLEAAAASGLRAIRYALEVEGVDSVVALDNDRVAVKACEQNIKLNGDEALSKVHAELGDARLYMISHENQFDVVDVDPYGSPAIFLDSAVQCVTDGGLLMCTATDSAVLCGCYGEVCHSKYGSYSLHGEHSHEMAIRILLSSVESHANRYKRIIVPVLSVWIDFYVRVFVRIYISPKSVKDSPSKLSYIYQCAGCRSFYLQPVGQAYRKGNGVSYNAGVGPTVSLECKECRKHWRMGGPLWSNPLHDSEWVSSILQDLTQSKRHYPAFDKMHCLLTAVSEELPDVPLFVNLHALSATLKCIAPSNIMVFSALGNAGYRSSGSHVTPLALKTDAPMHVIWDILRCWVKLHPIKKQPDSTTGSIILCKEPTLQADFSRVKKARGEPRKRRFMPNPEENWGPKSRAGRKVRKPRTSSARETHNADDEISEG